MFHENTGAGTTAPHLREEARTSASTPTFRMLFDGLFFFCFTAKGKGRKCKVGFLTSAPGHIQLLRVVEIKDGKQTPRTFVLTRHLLRCLRRVVFKFGNCDPAEAVEYEGKEEFNRKACQGDPEDFRWLLDFEDKELHEYELPKKKGILRPFLIINAGRFFTKLRDEKHMYLKKKVTADPGEFEPYGFIAMTAAMDLKAVTGKRLTLTLTGKFREPKRPGASQVDLRTKEIVAMSEEFKFDFVADEGVNYVVHLINARPEHLDLIVNNSGLEEDELCSIILKGTAPQVKKAEEEEQEREEVKEERHDRHPGHVTGDVHFYYHAFKVDAAECFEFIHKELPMSLAPRDAVTTSVPPLICYAARGSKSKSLEDGDEEGVLMMDTMDQEMGGTVQQEPQLQGGETENSPEQNPAAPHPSKRSRHRKSGRGKKDTGR